jgi:hypothetical protein
VFGSGLVGHGFGQQSGSVNGAADSGAALNGGCAGQPETPVPAAASVSCGPRPTGRGGLLIPMEIRGA